MRKLGISLRVSEAENYQESRDAIAHDWYGFLASLGWHYNWVLLPNLGHKIKEYAKQQGIGGIILTGGNDIGDSTVRDESEITLLEFATQNSLPVLGVCRGLQLMYRQYGGETVQLHSDSHIACRHQVNLHTELPFEHGDRRQLDVNSYHATLLKPTPIKAKIMATDNHGYVEAIINTHTKMAGVMWHPEREATCSEFDSALFNWLFRG